MNNKDIFDYHIYIGDFSQLLLWLMVVCFLGLCITVRPMLVISRFFVTKKHTKFSIMNFKLPYSFTKFKGIIDNISDKTKDTVRMNLKLDYYFMPFAYLFLFFSGWYVLQRHNPYLPEKSSYYWVLWVPCVAWVFDILENKIAHSCIEVVTKAKARSLFFVSLIKWMLVLGYVVFLLVAEIFIF